MYNLDILLNDVQKSAVEDTEGRILVLSGAGSGKTRVLTARVAYLVKCCGVDPYNILAITFTNKAAKEMVSRIESSLDGVSSVWAATFHSFCAKILRFHADRLGYTSNYTIYSDSDTERVIKRLCAERHIDDTKIKDDIICTIGRAKCFGLPPAAVRNEFAASKNIDSICAVYEAYEDTLRSSNAMDFDDLLLKTVELFLTCPDILEKYQNRFRYINVDEFQDTNKTQYMLIRLLAGKHGNVFVVGDEDQSIYSWRGADINNILNFQKDFKDAKVYKLEQNYRSTNAILTAANNVICNNRQRLGKKLWTAIDGGNKIDIYNAYGDREEADYVVQRINELVRLSGYQYRDIAILFRINALTRPFEDRLNQYVMPYKLFGGFKFYERKEVKDILAYMRIAVNPKDNEAILRVINFPKRGIGDGAVNTVMEYCKMQNIDLVDALLSIDSNYEISQGTKNKLAVFKNILCQIIGFNGSTSELLDTILKAGGIEAYYQASTDSDDNDRYENILELASAVRDFEKDNPDASYSDFLQSVALVSDTDNILDDNYVTLATVHAVKGLEFPVVFVVALEEGIFPTTRSINENSLEEERRLMYVAITRARERLYCSSARTRYRFKQFINNPRSRFVDEMKGAAAQKTLPQTSTNRIAASNGVYKVQNNGITSPKQAAPQPKIISTDFKDFVKGRKVEHIKFGEGTILETYGEGMDKSALINFAGVGAKKFLLMIANLKLKD